MRTVDVAHDDALCVPGFEFHYYDYSPEGGLLVSQIPDGYVGRSRRGSAACP